jgi:hypothetical protein
VRIRTAGGCTQWAGTAKRPEGFIQIWTDNDAAVAAPPSWTGDTAPPHPNRASDTANTIASRTAVPSLKEREMADSGMQ